MPGLPDDRDRGESAATDFLVTDLDLALTFMDIAETTRIEATAHRNRENARQAYNKVLEFLSRPIAKHIDRDSVESKMAILKARLDAVGYGP